METFISCLFGISIGMYIGVKFMPKVMAREKEIQAKAKAVLRELAGSGHVINESVTTFVNRFAHQVKIEDSSLHGRAEDVLARMKAEGHEITTTLRAAADTFIKHLLK